MVWMILNHVKLSISLSPFLRKVQHDFASPCAALLWLASHALGRAQKDAVSITTLHPRLVTERGSCSWTAESDAAPSRYCVSAIPSLPHRLRNSGTRTSADANGSPRVIQCGAPSQRKADVPSSGAPPHTGVNLFRQEGFIFA